MELISAMSSVSRRCKKSEVPPTVALSAKCPPPDDLSYSLMAQLPSRMIPGFGWRVGRLCECLLDSKLVSITDMEPSTAVTVVASI